MNNTRERLFLIYKKNDLLKIKKTESNFTINLNIPQNESTKSNHCRRWKIGKRFIEKLFIDMYNRSQSLNTSSLFVLIPSYLRYRNSELEYLDQNKSTLSLSIMQKISDKTICCW